MQAFKMSALSLAVLLAACGSDGDDGSTGTNGSNGLNALTSTETLAAGSTCTNGGITIHTGIDANADGVLASSEITASETLCNGTSDLFELQLLHFADVDGGRDIVGNVKYFSALVDTFRGEYDNTVLLSSGDNWIPGPDYSVAADLSEQLGNAAAGRAHVAFLNELGVQASAFGNHEFDLGTAEVAGLLAADGDWQGAQFPYLSSNLDFSASDLSALVGEDGTPAADLAGKVAASAVIRVGGEVIGVVGATTPTLATISSPDGITVTPEDHTDYTALAAIIQQQVDALTDEGINKVVLLAHMQQIAIEKTLAPLLSGVDIIVAGGSNTILADSNDRLRDGDSAADSYPLAFTSSNNEPVLVVNTDGDYTYLGRLVVNFDEDGVIVEELLNDSINGAYAADEQGLLENAIADADMIDGVVTLSDALQAALIDRVGTVFGKTDVYLNGERGSVRTEETNLGNLTAEANLVYAQATDASVAISLKNGGGIRAAIGSCSYPAGSTNPEDLTCSAPAGVEGVNEAGDISQLDIETSLRFNNSLALITVNGEQLKEIVEHAVAGWAEGSTPGSFGQVAGIRYSFDPTQDADSRIVNLVVLDSNGAEADGDTVTIVENGALDATAATQTFRMVTLGYLGTGGDGYPFPYTDAAADFVDLEEAGVQSGAATFADNGTEQDAFAEYLLANHPTDGSNNFADEDTDAANDSVIQNLSVVETDTVLSND